MAKDSGAILCSLVCMCIMLIPPGLAAVVIGVQNYGDPCQGHDPTGLRLDDWCIIAGSVLLGMASSILLAALISFLKKDWTTAVSVATFVFIVLCCLFYSAWNVTGIVLLARSNGACIKDNTQLGGMVVALFVLASIQASVVGRTSVSIID